MHGGDLEPRCGGGVSYLIVARAQPLSGLALALWNWT